MATIATESQITSRTKNRLAEQVGWAGDDDSGKVSSGCARDRGFVHSSQDVFDVTRIDGGGLNLDEDLIGTGDGLRNVRNLQSVKGAGFFEAERTHGNREFGGL